MNRTLCRGSALYDDRRRTNLHHVGDSSKIQNELGETVKSELNDVADPASRNKLQTMRENAKSHGWKIEAELNRLALVQLIPDFEMLLARLIALTDAMHDPARSQDKFD